MKSALEMIEIMEAYTKGAKIEYKNPNMPSWQSVTHPSWNWSDYDYRIKKHKQNVTIEKWLVKETNLGIHVVVETENIDNWVSSVENYEKVKLIERYTVTI